MLSASVGKLDFGPFEIFRTPEGWVSASQELWAPCQIPKSSVSPRQTDTEDITEPGAVSSLKDSEEHRWRNARPVEQNSHLT